MDHERPTRKRQRVVARDSDDESRKQRGRPRVDGQDETAADRRRTQIRLAQRAYRQRKENTISSLKQEVAALQATVENMNKAFLGFNDRIISSNLLQNSSDLTRELRNTTEHFLTLTRTVGTGSSGDSGESDTEHPNILSAEVAPEPSQQLSNTQSEESRTIDIGMGYVQILDDSLAHGQLTPPTEMSDFHYPAISNISQPPHLFQPLGVTNSDFTLFPSTSVEPSSALVASSYQFQTLNDPTQGNQQRSPESHSVSLIKSMTVPAPYTFSVNEITFARRLQRAGFERAFHLLSKAESRPEAYRRVFRLSLPYHSRDSLMSKVRSILTTTTLEALDVLHTPFIELGGAGTHYSNNRQTNAYRIKFGPIGKARLQHVETGLDPGIEFDIDMKEYEGEWFDSNDVEGYLMELGMKFNPRSSFAEAVVPNKGPLVQLLRRNGLINEPDMQENQSIWTPPSNLNTVAGSIPGQDMPTTLSNAAVEEIESSESRLFQELGINEDMGWPSNDLVNAAGWLMGSGDKTPEFLSSGWTAATDPSPWESSDALSETLRSLSHSPDNVVEKMRKVTLDIGGLIDYIISRGICLGRAPGFRKKDVEQALITSIIEVT